MQKKWHSGYGVALATLGGLVSLWGLLGLAQMARWGQPGYDTGWGAGVVRVEPGGPADVAGLEMGDRILGIDGVPIGNPWQNPSRLRVGVGRVQSLQVDRGGEPTVIPVTWGPLTTGELRARVVDALVTLSFLGFGLWALLASGTQAGGVLALFGLCYAVANFQGPALGFLEGAVPALQSHVSLFYTVLLFHFLMIYPRPKAIFRKRWGVGSAYVPFLLFVVSGVVAGSAYPRFLDGYAQTAGLTDLLYMCLALAALVHSWIVTPRAERHRSGFNWIPVGLTIAIGPFVALALVRLAVPGFGLQVEGYLGLLGAVIPGSMALAVVKGGDGPTA